MSRRWILSLLLAVGAVTVLAGATVASAHGRGGVKGGEVLDRVASILGIEREELDDAFAEARSEIAKEQRTAALATLVEDGTLTQDEADAIAAWLDAKPDALDGIKPSRFSVFKFHRFAHDEAHAPGALQIPMISTELLGKLVDAGKLTQEDADAIQAWLDARPESADKLVPEPVQRFKHFAPFGGDGYFHFEGDGEIPDLDGLRERLEEFKESLPEFDGELPDFGGSEGGFFRFGGDGFEFEFKGGPGFFFHGGEDLGGRGFHGFKRFHSFPRHSAPETPDDVEPVNL